MRSIKKINVFGWLLTLIIFTNAVIYNNKFTGTTPNKFYKVEILKFCKKVDSTSKFYKKYEANCTKWVLTKKDLEIILLKSKKISGQVFQYDFSILPCSYEGTALVNDSIRVQFVVNSGSSTTIVQNHKTTFFGYYGKQNYFLAKPGIEN